MQQSNTPWYRPTAMVTACGARMPLYGTPCAYEDSRQGAATVILGMLDDGTPLAVAVSSLQWLEALEAAARQAWAGGKVRGGMDQAVTR